MVSFYTLDNPQIRRRIRYLSVTSKGPFFWYPFYTDVRRVTHSSLVLGPIKNKSCTTSKKSTEELFLFSEFRRNTCMEIITILW